MTLHEFLISPEEFDFKLLMEDYYQEYQHLHKDDDAYKELLECLKDLSKTTDAIERWYLYKTLDSDRLSKNGCLFDCDSSNGTCDLTTNIYNTLWSAQINGGQLTGDTMNSFAYTFGHYGGGSFRTVYQKYLETTDKKEFQEIFSVYAHRVSCLGNFTLVPRRYNGRRGIGKCKDYWDLSLNFLKLDWEGAEEKENTWLGKTKLSFAQYINTFFLWDYVDTQYQVLPLFSRHQILLDDPDAQISVFPEENDEYKKFTTNASRLILRRGIFMAAMLRIAQRVPMDYAFFVEKIFSDGKCLGSMGDVIIQMLQLQGLSTDTQRELNKLKLQILGD